MHIYRKGVKYRVPAFHPILTTVLPPWLFFCLLVALYIIEYWQ